MQLFGTKLFPNSRIFLFVILKKVVTIDKFQTPSKLSSSQQISTILGFYGNCSPLECNPIFSIFVMRMKKKWLRVWVPLLCSPFVVETFDRFVHGCGQSTSLLLPLSRVVGVSSVGNSEIDEYQSWPTTLRPQRKQRGRNRKNGEEKLEPWSMRTTACPSVANENHFEKIRKRCPRVVFPIYHSFAIIFFGRIVRIWKTCF